MNQKLIFATVLIFVSTLASAQDFKMGPAAFFPDAWVAGRELVKTISEGVLGTHRIQEEAKQRTTLLQRLLGHKKSYSERMVERRTRIKVVRQELLEANRNLKPASSKSAQELETELFSLLALDSSPEEESKSDSLVIDVQETDRPLLLQKSAQSGEWQVPGILAACKDKGSTEVKTSPKASAAQSSPTSSTGTGGNSVDAMCKTIVREAEKDTSIRDAVLTVTGMVAGAISNVPVIGTLGDLVGSVVSLAQTAISNTVESQKLAARVFRLNKAMGKLTSSGSLTQRPDDDLRKVFGKAVKLLQEFQPDPSRSCLEDIQAIKTQCSSGTTQEFADIHDELTRILVDRGFTGSLEDTSVALIEPTDVEIDLNLAPIGVGAFGVVRAGTLYGSIAVAVKELQHCSGDFAQTLQQEVERMRHVSGPNVVKVYGLLCSKNIDTPSGIVMERLGDDLEKVTGREQLEPAQKMAYTRDLISGMARVHKGGLVHFDLKLKNVLRTEDKHSVKIIDFGISLSTRSILFENPEALRGTPHYMAPEQFDSQLGECGTKCDVYAFGVLLYELWSGKKAWEGFRDVQIRESILAGRAPASFDQMRNSGVPGPIAKLIGACWQQQPENRPSFHQMLEIREIDSFWRSTFDRWPTFLRNLPLANSVFPGVLEFRALQPQQLALVLSKHYPNAVPIADWLKSDLVDGERFFSHLETIAQDMRKAGKAEHWIVAFEKLHHSVFEHWPWYQEEVERSQVLLDESSVFQRLLLDQREAYQRRLIEAAAAGF